MAPEQLLRLQRDEFPSCVLAGVTGARLSGGCFRVKLCGFGLMSLAGMHLLRSGIPQAKVKYTPRCITTEKLQRLRY